MYQNLLEFNSRSFVMAFKNVKTGATREDYKMQHTVRGTEGGIDKRIKRLARDTPFPAALGPNVR
jgi:hypothetical protein